VVSLLGILPTAYIVSLGGCRCCLHPERIREAYEGKLRFGAVVAFVVSASPFTLLGIGFACWSLVIAVAAALLAEREDLLEHWRGTMSSHNSIRLLTGGWSPMAGTLTCRRNRVR
jgi:predicted benzoate:H+ symporter BenE